MSERFKKAIKKAYQKLEREEWVYGRLGRLNSDLTYTFTVPGRANFVYVTIRLGSGGQTVVPARNDASVQHAPNLAVKMKLEYGVYVIHGKTGRDDLATTAPTPPSGVLVHTHAHNDLTGWDDFDNHPQYHNDARGDLRYAPIDIDFTYLGDVPTSYTGQGGKYVVVKMTEDGLEFSTATGGYTQEEIEDFVGGMLTGAQTGISVTYNDGTGDLVFDAQTAGDARYAPIAKGVTNGDSHDHLGGDGGTIAYSSLSGAPTVYTQEDIEDFAGAMVNSNTETGISVTYDDATGKLNFDAQTAGDLRYAPIAKGVTNGDSHDHLGGDGATIAYSSLSGTPTVYTQEEIEDFVGAMLGGTQTGIAVAYVDASGLITFDAQTAGDARYGRLATANSWTQNQSIASTQTTGNALNVTRNLTATSTDSPVVSFVQDHATDDQIVLRIQQDAPAAIVSVYDTTDLVFQIADGGRVLVTTTATSGASLSVVRDLASASTDWPVVDFIQDNTGDDQTVLQVRQDGTGDIAAFKDGVNTVLQILDGGRFVFNQVGSTGKGFSFNRNLSSASTDSVVFEVVQDNTGDDQAAVRIQQDGTGNILDLYDGATLTFSVADGGAVNAKGAVDFDSTLNVDGAATFQSTVTLSPGGTQDYSLSDDGANALTLNALGAGKDFDFRIHTQDADGTDNVLFSLYAIGKPGSYTNYERGRLIYAAAGPEFRFDTGAAGTGTVRPLVLLTQGNTNQIRLATDGFVGFKVATPKGLVHGHDGTGGFLHVTKTGIVGSAVEIIPDGTGDVTKAVKITGMASNSTPSNFDVSLFVANGGTGDITDGGGNTLRFAVAANGQLTVIRQAGALTWSCTVWLSWE